jgi:1-acyl-sn-glycerol-3-phosphate acyltransferase
MSPDAFAILVLAAYAVIAAALVTWQVRRGKEGWQAWMLYCVERVYIGMMYHWRSNRRCPFAECEGALIIANHRGPLDPLLIWMNHHLGRRDGRLRMIGFLMAREYSEMPVLHWIAKVTRSIPVDRQGADMAPVRMAYRQLQAGDLIGIFPEGGINEGEGLRAADTGVAWLALKAQVPVFPVYIDGSPRGENMVEPFYSPSRVTLHFGDAVDLSSYYECRKSQEILHEVTDLLMTRLAELGGVEYARPTHAPQTLPMERGAG